MKQWAKQQLACGTVLVAILFVGLVALPDKHPSYSELKASCDSALSKSPHSETLDAWMSSYQISPHRHIAPLDESFKNILVSNGISQRAVDNAASCTYFEQRVQGGVLSRHVCYGYFVFASGGALIEYSVHDIFYGM
jgi:hypothetical protein